jgi:hypothetical protein
MARQTFYQLGDRDVRESQKRLSLSSLPLIHREKGRIFSLRVRAEGIISMSFKLMTRILLALLTAFLVGSAGNQSLAKDPGLFGLTAAHPMKVDKQAGEVRILAELQPEAFSGGWIKWTPNYHAVVWKEGGAAGEALLVSPVSDSAVYDALVSVGAVPGNNLTMASWNDRKDPNAKAPRMRVEGTPVEVLVQWEGLPRPLPLKRLLVDPGGRGIDMRFGGNKALIPQWKSGCIACLYSCPGGKVSNRAYTIRDYVDGTTKFSVDYSVVPRGKRPAVVIFRLRKG